MREAPPAKPETMSVQAAGGGQLNAGAHVVADPRDRRRRAAEPVQPTTRMADRSCTEGSMPSLAMVNRY